MSIRVVGAGSSGTVRRWKRRALLALAFVVVQPVSAWGQAEIEWDPTQTRATRPALESLLRRYEQAAASSAYSDSLRALAGEQAALLRERLEQGDFPAGSRVAIWVEEQAAMTDTFGVAADRAIQVPGVGTISLAGVLRSELQDRVSEAVARIILEPRVRTQSLLTLSIDGEVQAPGHYLVDSDNPLSTVLMRGGGLTPDARRGSARVERGAETVVDADRFQGALRAGTSIDQLGIREGDRIFVPEGRGELFDTLREYILVIPALLGLLTLLG